MLFVKIQTAHIRIGILDLVKLDYRFAPRLLNGI